MSPASVISRPEDHQLRKVKSDFAAPTMKCAMSDTVKAITRPVVPPTKKKGITGMIAPIPVLVRPAIPAVQGFPPFCMPPNSSEINVFNMASLLRASFVTKSSASAFVSPFSW